MSQKKTPWTLMDIEEVVAEVCRKPTLAKIGKIVALLDERTLDRICEEESMKLQILSHLLQLPQRHRNKEICHVLNRMLRKLPCLRQLQEGYGEDAVYDMYKSMQKTVEPEGKQIIKIGDEADRMYIILRGSALVLYPRQEIEISKESINRKLGGAENEYKKLVFGPEARSHYGELDPNTVQAWATFFNDIGVPLFQVENTLKKGDSFGQLGILYNQPRMSHIICREECLMATVDSSQYLQIISNKWQSGRVHSKLFFLQQHFYPDINKLDIRMAQRFMYLFSEVEFKVNSRVVQIHSQIVGAYLMVEGSVALKRQKNSLESYSTANVSRVGKLPKGMNELESFKKLVTGDCIGLTEIITNGIDRNIFYEYEAVALSNCKFLFCPTGKLMKAVHQDKKLMAEMRKKVREGWDDTKENQIDAYPQRYYLKKCNNKSDRGCIRQENSVDSAFKDLSISTYTKKHHYCKSNVMLSPSKPVEHQSYSQRRVLKKRTSLYPPQVATIKLGRPIPPNVQRILTDPFSYY